MDERLRVLVVDDSALFRHAISRIIESTPRFKVVATAVNGQEAVAKAAEFRPDLITLDVQMPGMDGLAALTAIMEHSPTRVLMVSSLTTRGARVTIQALCLGALDFVTKSGNQGSQLETQLLAKLDAVMQAGVPGYRRAVPRDRPQRAPTGPPASGLIVIGASTGGPAALDEVLGRLDPGLPAAVLVIQHMPPGFTASLADRLDGSCPLPVREAGPSNQLRMGTVLLAAGGAHLVVTRRGESAVVDGPSRHGVRPSVDVTLESAVRHYGARLITVILTGMGCDGTAGSRQVREAGGRVIAQDEATSTVYGMPAAVTRAGLANLVLPISQIGRAASRMGGEFGGEYQTGGAAARSR
ncbi:MAG TPA: chemotaxis response regulator protein-glutamate methylesterase [Clostridiales bacterium UBA8153]|nr:chemotaxis response regulator protein-glutamate methylesterase [Clostridiales bacterium UBA8153]